MSPGNLMELTDSELSLALAGLHPVLEPMRPGEHQGSENRELGGQPSRDRRACWPSRDVG